HLLLSVMSRLGTARRFLSSLFILAGKFGVEATERINKTGDLVGAPAGEHQCHLFVWSELEALLRRHACTIVATSAANYLSVGYGHDEFLREIVDDPPRWEAFLRWEVEFCREPGALDGGTHIIAVVQRTRPSPARSCLPSDAASTSSTPTAK